MKPKDFQNIIFDLGGVILNIDYSKTIAAFRNLGLLDFENNYSQLVQTDLFDNYERGEISSADFRNGIRAVFRMELSDAEIDHAWNMMLLDLPPQRLDLLHRLGSEKKLALLSNTNEIHIHQFEKSLMSNFGFEDLSDYFQKLYYSYHVGMRKPEERIFQLVLDEMGFNPSETLFIDDSPQHIDGAKKVGLQTYHLWVDRGETILDLF